MNERAIDGHLRGGACLEDDQATDAGRVTETFGFGLLRAWSRPKQQKPDDLVTTLLSGMPAVHSTISELTGASTGHQFALLAGQAATSTVLRDAATRPRVSVLDGIVPEVPDIAGFTSDATKLSAFSKLSSGIRGPALTWPENDHADRIGTFFTEGFRASADGVATGWQLLAEAADRAPKLGTAWSQAATASLRSAADHAVDGIMTRLTQGVATSVGSYLKASPGFDTVFETTRGLLRNWSETNDWLWYETRTAWWRSRRRSYLFACRLRQLLRAGSHHVDAALRTFIREHLKLGRTGSPDQDADQRQAVVLALLESEWHLAAPADHEFVPAFRTRVGQHTGHMIIGYRSHNDETVVSLEAATAGLSGDSHRSGREPWSSVWTTTPIQPDEEVIAKLFDSASSEIRLMRFIRSKLKQDELALFALRANYDTWIAMGHANDADTVEKLRRKVARLRAEYERRQQGRTEAAR